MGTIKTGFWNFKFIITPNEFSDFIKECLSNNISFYRTDYEAANHNHTKVVETYKKYYDTLVEKEKKSAFNSGCVYSMLYIRNDESRSGFFMRDEDIRVFSGREYFDRTLYYINIFLAKGIAVDYEDEKGKYFVYEDILIHQPEMYPIYQKITNFIKLFTKPLRFNSEILSEIREIKPSGVRISEQASKDIAESWYFKKHNLEMISYKSK
ncbi:hypothetical protein [uncultured Chryseobacterium sp.]|uniref:hypothetical protein n=1 Tax=uncultured Chryseobacterium sp. TaxID=259322 RepID=UPI0025884A31|nr:hypothetical protein [uncultured Chryseobacterium sp.]